ncbi:hyaluronidase PH-20-like [Genypterus blacodes]|uniref:hyaluronidase PH-20-like n=1 Tax=Genypterus blacodes TaxID=154954 RepID=UPI003F775148
MAPPPLSSMAVFFFTCVTCVTGVLALPPTAPLLIAGRPFLAVWNAPIQQCRKLDIPLDTAAFQAVTTPQMVPGQFLTLFYDNNLGLYPKADLSKQKRYRGGIPQSGNLTRHLAKAQREIDHYIFQDSSPGLAVIDWEAWRPLWDRNWGSKRIYQKLSIAHAIKIAPFLSYREIVQLARNQFQNAGRRFMERTISLGLGERPSRRWGFYLFPDCYNYDWKKVGYTGKCSRKTQRQNDHMLWLWERSSALFPSVYIPTALSNSNKTALFVQNRVQEALRVAALPNRPYTVPIYVYCRLLYRNQSHRFLSQSDLVSSVGESAALGASGVILWGGSSDFKDGPACQSLSEYLLSTFNPYITNVTAAATLCSNVLCQGNGRCVRKRYDSAHYLHLNPAHFRILRADRKYLAVGLPSHADLDLWADGFTCQCFAGRSCRAKLSYPEQMELIWV